MEECGGSEASGMVGAPHQPSGNDGCFVIHHRLTRLTLALYIHTSTSSAFPNISDTWYGYMSSNLRNMCLHGTGYSFGVFLRGIPKQINPSPNVPTSTTVLSTINIPLSYIHHSCIPYICVCARPSSSASIPRSAALAPINFP